MSYKTQEKIKQMLNEISDMYIQRYTASGKAVAALYRLLAYRCNIIFK